MPTAVVTGAGRGLGRAISERLARDGYHVVAVDLDATSAAATAEAVGGESRACDVSDAASVAELAASLGEVNALVNNAGIWLPCPTLDVTPADALKVLQVNVVGTLYCSQALIPKMIEAGGGPIVSISSAAAYTHSPGVGLYPASKAGVESLTKQLALEFGRQGIRANAVGPGLIVTEGTVHNFEGERRDQRAKLVPMGRVGEPSDIADVVGFLCSPDSRYVTGQVIYVDGGVSAGRAAI
ncbi:MAG: SDR family oxidoreductase [Acidimicrobiales bacterium]|nr:SDR family oxidoreductase [Acidimicrobiales bacterium]